MQSLYTLSKFLPFGAAAVANRPIPNASQHIYKPKAIRIYSILSLFFLFTICFTGLQLLIERAVKPSDWLGMRGGNTTPQKRQETNQGQCPAPAAVSSSLSSLQSQHSELCDSYTVSLKPYTTSLNAQMQASFDQWLAVYSSMEAKSELAESCGSSQKTSSSLSSLLSQLTTSKSATTTSQLISSTPLQTTPQSLATNDSATFTTTTLVSENTSPSPTTQSFSTSGEDTSANATTSVLFQTTNNSTFNGEQQLSSTFQTSVIPNDTLSTSFGSSTSLSASTISTVVSASTESQNPTSTPSDISFTTTTLNSANESTSALTTSYSSPAETITPLETSDTTSLPIIDPTEDVQTSLNATTTDLISTSPTVFNVSTTDIGPSENSTSEITQESTASTSLSISIETELSSNTISEVSATTETTLSSTTTVIVFTSAPNLTHNTTALETSSISFSSTTGIAAPESVTTTTVVVYTNSTPSETSSTIPDVSPTSVDIPYGNITASTSDLSSVTSESLSLSNLSASTTAFSDFESTSFSTQSSSDEETVLQLTSEVDNATTATSVQFTSVPITATTSSLASDDLNSPSISDPTSTSQSPSPTAQPSNNTTTCTAIGQTCQDCGADMCSCQAPSFKRDEFVCAVDPCHCQTSPTSSNSTICGDFDICRDVCSGPYSDGELCNCDSDSDSCTCQNGACSAAEAECTEYGQVCSSCMADMCTCGSQVVATKRDSSAIPCTVDSCHCQWNTQDQSYTCGDFNICQDPCSGPYSDGNVCYTCDADTCSCEDRQCSTQTDCPFDSSCNTTTATTTSTSSVETTSTVTVAPQCTVGSSCQGCGAEACMCNDDSSMGPACGVDTCFCSLNTLTEWECNSVNMCLTTQSTGPSTTSDVPTTITATAACTPGERCQDCDASECLCNSLPTIGPTCQVNTCWCSIESASNWYCNSVNLCEGTSVSENGVGSDFATTTSESASTTESAIAEDGTSSMETLSSTSASYVSITSTATSSTYDTSTTEATEEATPAGSTSIADATSTTQTMTSSDPTDFNDETSTSTSTLSLTTSMDSTSFDRDPSTTDDPLTSTQSVVIQDTTSTDESFSSTESTSVEISSSIDNSSTDDPISTDTSTVTDSTTTASSSTPIDSSSFTDNPVTTDSSSSVDEFLTTASFTSTDTFSSVTSSIPTDGSLETDSSVTADSTTDVTPTGPDPTDTTATTETLFDSTVTTTTTTTDDAPTTTDDVPTTITSAPICIVGSSCDDCDAVSCTCNSQATDGPICEVDTCYCSWDSSWNCGSTNVCTSTSTADDSTVTTASPVDAETTSVSSLTDSTSTTSSITTTTSCSPQTGAPSACVDGSYYVCDSGYVEPCYAKQVCRRDFHARSPYGQTTRVGCLEYGMGYEGTVLNAFDADSGQCYLWYNDQYEFDEEGSGTWDGALLVSETEFAANSCPSASNSNEDGESINSADGTNVYDTSTSSSVNPTASQSSDGSSSTDAPSGDASTSVSCDPNVMQCHGCSLDSDASCMCGEDGSCNPTPCPGCTFTDDGTAMMCPDGCGSVDDYRSRLGKRDLWSSANHHLQGHIYSLRKKRSPKTNPQRPSTDGHNGIAERNLTDAIGSHVNKYIQNFDKNDQSMYGRLSPRSRNVWGVMDKRQGIEILSDGVPTPIRDAWNYLMWTEALTVRRTSSSIVSTAVLATFTLDVFPGGSTSWPSLTSTPPLAIVPRTPACIPATFIQPIPTHINIKRDTNAHSAKAYVERESTTVAVRIRDNYLEMTSNLPTITQSASPSNAVADVPSKDSSGDDGNGNYNGANNGGTNNANSNNSGNNNKGTDSNSINGGTNSGGVTDGKTSNSGTGNSGNANNGGTNNDALGNGGNKNSNSGKGGTNTGGTNNSPSTPGGVQNSGDKANDKDSGSTSLGDATNGGASKASAGISTGRNNAALATPQGGNSQGINGGLSSIASGVSIVQGAAALQQMTTQTMVITSVGADGIRSTQSVVVVRPTAVTSGIPATTTSGITNTGIDDGDASDNASDGGGGGGANSKLKTLTDNQRIINVPFTNASYVGAMYMPTIMAVVIKILFETMVASIKMMEPFERLHRSEGANAEESLCSQYLSSSLSFDNFRSIWSGRSIPMWTTIIYVFISVGAPLASASMTVEPMDICVKAGAQRLCDPAWVVDVRFIRSMEVLLAICMALTLILAWNSWTYHAGVPSNPTSIASMAVLLNYEPLRYDLQKIDPNATEEELQAALEEHHFWLIPHSPTKNELRYGIVNAQAIAKPAAQSIHPIFDTIEERVNQLRSRMPVKRMVKISDSANLFITVTLLVLLMTYRANLRDDAFNRFFGTGKIVAKVIMVSLASALDMQWKDLERKVRVTEPYRRLWLGNARPENTILYTLNGTCWSNAPRCIKGVFQYSHMWFEAVVGLTAILSDINIIAVSGLLMTVSQTKSAYEFSSVTALMATSIMLVVSLVNIFWWRRTEAVSSLPRTPETVGVVLSYLSVSRMAVEFADMGLENLSAKDRDEAIISKGRRYKFGTVMGEDGKERYCVDYDDKPLDKGALVRNGWL